MSAVLHGAMRPQGDRYAEAREAFDRMPLFSGGSQHWEDFIAPYQKVEKETPFAITLQKAPEPGIRELYVGRPIEHTFFGILASRSDGKLGRLCFGEESKDFGNNDASGRISIFCRDGLDAHFLRVHQQKDGFFRPERMHKVVSLDCQWKSVMAKLARRLTWLMGDSTETPNEVQAVGFAKLRRHVEDFLAIGGHIGQGIEIENLLRALSARIELRTLKLEREVLLLKEQLSEKAREIKLLKHAGEKESETQSVS